MSGFAGRILEPAAFGATEIHGALTVGRDAGPGASNTPFAHDVVFNGSTAAKKFTWDASSDTLTIDGNLTIADTTTFNGSLVGISSDAISDGDSNITVADPAITATINDATVVTINASGLTVADSYTLSAETIVETSDRMFKEDIRNANTAESESIIQRLKLRTFKPVKGLERSKRNPQARQTGLIAQEVDEILPEAVRYSDHAYLRKSALIDHLIGAVQRLQERVRVLEGRKAYKPSVYVPYPLSRHRRQFPL